MEQSLLREHFAWVLIQFGFDTQKREINDWQSPSAGAWILQKSILNLLGAHTNSWEKLLLQPETLKKKKGNCNWIFDETLNCRGAASPPPIAEAKWYVDRQLFVFGDAPTRSPAPKRSMMSSIPITFYSAGLLILDRVWELYPSRQVFLWKKSFVPRRLPGEFLL